MPNVKPGESKDEYIPRCISSIMGSETDDEKQAYAICNGLWEKHMKKKKEADTSLEKKLRDISTAFYQQFQSSLSKDEIYNLWLIETFDDYIVVGEGEEFFKITYQVTDGEYQFQSKNDWQKVEQQYIPVRESSIRVLEANNKSGSSWDIVVIGPDKPSDIIRVDDEVYIRSKNGYIYSAYALRESVELWEGAKVYDNHLTDQAFIETGGMRSPSKEWLGNIVEPYWDEDSLSVRGKFKVVDEGLRKKLINAEEEQVLETIGLSIDAWVNTEPITLEGNTVDVVTHIVQATSVDLVAEPAAGGRILRALAGLIKKEAIMPDEIFTVDQKEELKTLIGDTISSVVAEQLPEQVATAVEAALEKKAKEASPPADDEPEEDTPEGNPPADDKPDPAETDQVAEATTKALEAIQAETKKFETMQKVAECKVLLAENLRSSGLPAEFQTLLKRQFEGQVFKPEELEAAIKAQRDALMPLIETGQVTLPKGTNIQVLPITESDRYELAFMRLVMGATAFNELTKKEADYHKAGAVRRFIESGRPALPRVTRLSEFYTQYTEDYDYQGIMRNKRILEAAGTTSSLSSIVKNTVNLMLANDYNARHQWWNAVVRNEDVDTLDQATLVRFHGLDTLSVVPEGQAYRELSLSDEEETAVYVKKGDFIGITLETFLQDKLGVLRRLPNKLSIAWFNTISKLVSAVFTTASGVGPTLADTGVLFNATPLTTAGGHANLLTAAFSHTAFSAVRTAMRKQTDQPLGAGERLNIMPMTVLCPADLETTVELLEMSELIPTQNAGSGTEIQSANTFRGKFSHEVVPHWPDTNNWAAVADPAVFPAIWLIWLRGRRSPEVYTADSETAGSMFTHDTIRLKTRMFTFRKSATEDCAPVSDWRGLHKSNVA